MASPRCKAIFGRHYMCNNRGFTLFELLVVVVIIGVIINFAVISIGNSPNDPARNEAQRLNALLNLAIEEAMLRNEVIGLGIEENNYIFMRLENESWSAFKDSVFRPRELNDQLQLKLLNDESQPAEDETDKDSIRPNIFILPTGELSPFELKLTNLDNMDSYRLSGTEVGEILLVHADED